MPARTTVLSALSKYGSSGGRALLSSNSLLQMAGRAGRRGKDTVGHVVVVQTAFEGAEDCCRLLLGGADPLVSQFTATYGMALNLLAGANIWKHKLAPSAPNALVGADAPPVEAEVVEVVGGGASGGAKGEQEDGVVRVQRTLAEARGLIERSFGNFLGGEVMQKGQARLEELRAKESQLAEELQAKEQLLRDEEAKEAIQQLISSLGSSRRELRDLSARWHEARCTQIVPQLDAALLWEAEADRQSALGTPTWRGMTSESSTLSSETSPSASTRSPSTASISSSVSADRGLGGSLQDAIDAGVDAGVSALGTVSTGIPGAPVNPPPPDPAVAPVDEFPVALVEIKFRDTVVGNNQAVVGRLLARVELQLDGGAASPGTRQRGAPGGYDGAGKGSFAEEEGEEEGGEGEEAEGGEEGEGRAGDMRARLEVWEDDMSDLAGQGGVYYIMHSSTNGWYVFAASAVHGIHRVAVGGCAGKMPQRLWEGTLAQILGGGRALQFSPQRNGRGRSTSSISSTEGTPGADSPLEIPTLGIRVSAMAQGPWKRLTKSEPGRVWMARAPDSLWPWAAASRPPPALTGDTSWLASPVPGAAGELSVDAATLQMGRQLEQLQALVSKLRKAYKMSKANKHRLQVTVAQDKVQSVRNKAQRLQDRLSGIQPTGWPEFLQVRDPPCACLCLCMPVLCACPCGCWWEGTMLLLLLLVVVFLRGTACYSLSPC